MFDFEVVAGVACSFLLGAIPFGYLLVRLLLKKDVKSEGSGNIGATNVARVAGKKLGILTLLLDVAKGLICVFTALQLQWPPGSEAICGLAAFLGHCFTPFLKFKGGKGVATGLGVVALLVPWAALTGLLAFLGAYGASRRVSLGSMVGALGALVATWLLAANILTQICVTVLVLILIFRHKSNISRLVQKKELSL